MTIPEASVTSKWVYNFKASLKGGEMFQKRLLRAKVEFQTAHTYDYFVINDNVENAVRELEAIMTAEHCKPKERMEIINGN